MNSPPPSTTPPPPNLLDTITSEQRLLSRLLEMPSDSQTITLDLSGPIPDLQHPDWKDSPSLETPPNRVSHAEFSNAETAKREQQTDETANADQLTDGEGFVPSRKVLSFGSPCNDRQAEYRLVGKLGSGGTGIVYQAHQRAIDREVAIKVLREELASDPASRSRFLTEARVIGSLDHPNVISLHDLCIDDQGKLFYAMKRIDGTSWDQQIDEFKVEKNLTILLSVADAIRYAHSRGIVHRDIKPENVMLGRFGEVMLADWGLAVYKAAPSKRSHLDLNNGSSRTSSIGGTPAYMAPELALGDFEAVSKQTDIYLLGAILYQILTGKPPHHGENLLQCIRAAARNEIQPTDVQGELMEVARKAMATSPKDRFVSVEALSDAIADHRIHEESERLVRRATRRVWHSEVDPNDPYRVFGTGDALLSEAIELWPDNVRAHETLRRLQMELARVAASQGDLDLSLRVYESAGEGNSEVAAKVRRDLEHRTKVRESQAKYSTLFTDSPEAGLLIRWNDGVVMEINEACSELLGYQKEELVGKEISGLSIWACPDRRKQFVDRLGREGRVDNFEAQFVPKASSWSESNCDDTAESDGSGANSEVLDVLISSRTVEVGGEEMLLSTLRDISQRRLAERELEQSRGRLRDLQRLAGLGTWSLKLDPSGDPEQNEISWSAETFRVVGRDPALREPSMQQWLELLHPDDHEIITDAIENAVRKGTSYQVQFRMKDDSGVYRDVLSRGQPVLDQKLKAVEIYGILMSV